MFNVQLCKIQYNAYAQPNALNIEWALRIANSEQQQRKTKRKMFNKEKGFLCNANRKHSIQKDKRKQAKECEYDCRRPLFARSRYVLQFENMNAITFIETTKISQSYVFSFHRAYRVIVCCMQLYVKSESNPNAWKMKGNFRIFFSLLLIYWI